MSCGVGCRHGLGLALLWLWHRLAAIAPIQPPAWELPNAESVALKKKKRINNRSWVVEKGTLMHCWECKLVQSLWRTICRFLKKLKVEPPYDPAIPLLCIYIK